MTLRPLPLLALTATLAAVSSAQTRTWTDSQMGSWSSTTVILEGTSTSIASSQISSGGNPGACFRVENSLGQGGRARAVHLSTDSAATFVPATEGPFGRIELAVDVNVIEGSGSGNAMAVFTAVEQNGSIYRAACTYDVVFVSEGWVRLETELVAEQFFRVAGSGPLVPSFLSGSPFRVGFGTNSSTNGSGGTGIARFDNVSVTARTTPGNVGTKYCADDVIPNSFGLKGDLFADGSSVAGGQTIRLYAACIPDNSFSFFIASRQPGLVPAAGGFTGTLCLSGQISRLNSATAQNSGHEGWVSHDINTTAMVGPQGPIPIVPGDTWYFQCWHRDNDGTVNTSNLTGALAILFQ